MRSLLDHQADGIEYTLHSHGIEGSVVGGNVSPRLIQFHIKLGAGVKYNRVAALADELALALGVTHCRITRDGYYVKVEVPRPDPVAVRLFPLMRNLPGDLPPNSPVLGLDEGGVPLLLRLDSPDIAHILISGTTGSGKTVLARSMIASLALQNTPDQMRLLLIDPKGRGYRDFTGLPNLVCPVVTDPLDGLHRLKWAVRHMEKRDENAITSPLLVIFIDELADLMMVGGKEMEYQVTRLTQRGREAGIHLVACTQKPSASVIGGIAKSNFPTRLVGRVVSPDDARVASGVAGSGAEKLMGRGDFLLFARGETVRVQGAHINSEEMVQTVEHLGGTPGVYEQPRPVRQAEPQPKGGRLVEEVYPNSRQASRRKVASSYHAPTADAYADEDEDYYGASRPEGKRRFRAAGRDHDELPESMGVSDRLARYQGSIQERRRQPGHADFAEEEEYYSPARPQRGETRPRPRPAEQENEPTRVRPRLPNVPPPSNEDPDLWDELEADIADEFDPSDLEDPEERDFPIYKGPPARPTPRPTINTATSLKSVPPVNKNPAGADSGRKLISSVKARNNDSFKIGS